jgi:hypothetical protein
MQPYKHYDSQGQLLFSLFFISSIPNLILANSSFISVTPNLDLFDFFHDHARTTQILDGGDEAMYI